MFSPSSLNHVYRTVWNEALGAMVAVAENAPGHQGSGGSGVPAARIRGLGALSQLALAVALVWSVAPYAYANPEGGVAIHGQANMVSNGNVLTVTTQNGAGTNHSAINWQNFSIPAGSTTQIVQPSAASLSINRVVTNTPSVLFGTLSSNGQVVLVNQAGIAVGSGALVDTAGFTASAVGMTAQDAMAGRLRFAGDGITNTAGALTVEGNIIARGGDVVLIAPSVEVAHTAVVESQGGSVLLAAGQSVEVTGRGLEGITLQVQAPTDQAINLGTLKGDAVGIFAGTLKHSGLIQATQASVDGGRVVLKASGDAYVEGSGRIDVTSTTGKGGHIEVLGNNVAVTDNAVLDASGATGGGVVLVGGDYQGKNGQVQNANVTYFGANATLKADATQSGDGGKIVVWADDTTRAYGRLSARGGLAGGNGGFVEASGHRYLDFQGRADIGAPLGKAGLLLLDPNDITIDNSTDNYAGASFSSGIFSGGTGNPTLTWATINAQTGSLEVRTNSAAGSGLGDININASGVVTGPTTLTLLANRGLNIAPAVSVSGTGDFNLVAGWSNSGYAVTSGTSNNITLGAGSSVSTNGNVWLNAGNAVVGSNTATITANTLTIGNTNGGSLPGGVSLSGANMVNTLAVQSDGGGPLTFNNGKALTIGSGTYGIDGIVASGNPQAINISTTVGDLAVDKAIVSDVLGGASITLTAAGALNVNSAVTSTYNASPQGPIKLVAGAGGVTSTVAGLLTTNTLEVISGGSVALNAPNVVSTLAANVTGSGFGFTNSSGFAVGVAGGTTGVTVASGDISLTASGLNKLLTVSSNVQATSGNVVYIADNINHTAFTTTSGAAGKFVEIKPFTAATAIQFDAAADAPGILRLSSGELKFSTPMLKLGNSATTGGIAFNQSVTPANFNTLSLINSGSITQTTGSILTIANLNVDAGTGGVTLNESNVISGKLAGRAGAGGVQFMNASALNIGQVDVVNNGISTSGGGAISLTSLGAITQDAGALLSTTGTLSTISVGGTSLSNANTVRNLTAINTGSGNFTFTNASADLDVSVNNGTGTGAVLVKNSGNLGLLNTGVITPATGTAATLVAGGNFLNPSNFDITLTGTGARWLIYSTNPSANTVGSTLTSATDFQQYSATYPSSTVLGTGNGLLYSGASSSTVPNSLVGSVSKVYDGTTSAVLSPANFSLSGLTDPLFGNSSGVSLSSIGLVSYSTPNVGTGINVSSMGGAATVTFGAKTVYGYTVGSASAPIGEITPAPIIVTPVSASLGGTTNKVYDGNLSASLTPGNFLLAGFLGADSASVTKSTGIYASKDVGSAIGVSATLATTDFVPIGSTLLSNYTLPTIATGNIGVITPKPLTLAPTAANKVYDGTVAATVTDYGLVGFVAGELVKASSTSAAFDNKDVGVAKKVSISGITLADNTGLASNYSVPSAATAAATIDPAALSISATASNKVYDGTRAATVSLADNRIAGDALVLGFSSADFIDSGVGVAKAVTVMGIGVSGVDAGNYTYNTTAISAADITAAPTPIPDVDLNAPSNMVVSFFEKFQVAMQSAQPDPIVSARPNKDSDEDAGDKTGKEKDKDKLRAKDSIVLEGETCKP